MPMIINPPAIVRPPPNRTSFTNFKKMVKKHEIERVFVRNSTNDLVWEDKEGEVGVSSVLITAPFVDYLIDNNVDVNVEKIDEKMSGNWGGTLTGVIAAYALGSFIL